LDARSDDLSIPILSEKFPRKFDSLCQMKALIGKKQKNKKKTPMGGALLRPKLFT